MVSIFTASLENSASKWLPVSKLLLPGRLTTGAPVSYCKHGLRKSWPFKYIQGLVVLPDSGMDRRRFVFIRRMAVALQTSMLG